MPTSKDVTVSQVARRASLRSARAVGEVGPSFIGIDPGLSGAIVLIGPWEIDVFTLAGKSPADIWLFLSGTCKGRVGRDGFAMIEEQSPRPTQWWDAKAKRWQSSILKSTCLLWGSFVALEAMLVAAGIPHERVLPKRWQEALGIPKRARPETETQWKNRLKAKAQGLFPDQRVALASADALLIAEHCRRTRGDRKP